MHGELLDEWLFFTSLAKLDLPFSFLQDYNFNRASILVFFGWIPAYNRGYDGKKMDTRLLLAGMTEGERDPR